MPKSEEKTRSLCKWVKDNTEGSPTVGSLPPDLSSWLYYRRRKVREGWSLPESEQRILAEFGLDSLFSKTAYNLHDETLIKSYLAWLAEKGVEPRNNPENPEEYRLYRWLNRKQNSSAPHGNLPDSPIPNLLDKPLTTSQRSMIVAQRVIEWVSQEKRTPSSRAKGEEGFLGKWLANRRSQFRKKGIQTPTSILLSSASLL
jgi:hypothetical protein